MTQSTEINMNREYKFCIPDDAIGYALDSIFLTETLRSYIKSTNNFFKKFNSF